MRPLIAALFLVSTVLCGLANAADVEVVGLFKGRAVVRTSAGDEIVKVGQTSKSGVTLIEADSREAVVRFEGETHRLSLSRRIGSSFTEAQAQTVSINPDDQGQYRIQGFINRRRANFLVDTGASVVAMSSEHARSLGINFSIGQRGKVVTAQGEVDASFITLPQVNVGGVTAHNVQATVIEGRYPVEILLGMSYLNQVDMQNQGGVLTLSGR